MTNPPGTPAPVVATTSYRDLAPLEEGGRTAREGFAYQDHVTATKCLDMLLPHGPSEVWCEAEDDIVLVWSVGGAEEFEFVQVKAHNLGQAWTVAKLCAREPAKDGKAKKASIVEKSLAHDRGKEACRFRLVTTWAPEAVLNVLSTPLMARSSPQVVPDLGAATKAIEDQLGGTHNSPNGHSMGFWVERTTWEHRATVDDIKNENIVKLNRVLDIAGESLAPDQCDELYALLFAKVQDAALAHAVTHKLDKRLLRDALRQWLLGRAKRIQHPTHSGGTGPLVTKLTEAAIDASLIEGAKEMRRHYVAEARVPKYLPADDRETIELEVVATLHALKVALDSGKYTDDSREFLERCQDELRKMRDTLAGHRPSNSLLYGCMYEIMNRCLHRLARATP
ncbi:dsDNA nuclease domain-containing protein [Sorangium sp. So ce693]|uniref:dsDNA nuclease domain-containing protein n=1 Tax=Sorangium sp. So ce693 TaxID=3133318 RepID=UPI003F6407DB